MQKNNYTFYHGTSAENLRSIKKNGIDTEGTDFYATTNIWDTFGYGCDKVGNWDKKSSVLIIKPKEQAKLLDIGNPFYGIKMGFVTYNSEYYIFEVNQAELDNYAKANKYDAYIYPESLSGGGREVDYATRHRWIQILNKDAFTYEYLINKFPCFNYKKYNDNPSEYGKEYRTKIKQALVDNNIPEFEEFPERKIAEEKFDKISDELESSHYNHKMIEEKYGYETIMQAAHQIMRVPIYKEIEKFYLKNIDSAVLYDKTNELLGFNIEEFLPTEKQSKIDEEIMLLNSPDTKEGVKQREMQKIARQATIDRENEPEPQLTLLSFGGGQDSWAFLYAVINNPEFRKKYAPKDFVVAMSDTGNEFPYTYKYVLQAIALCEKHGIHFQFITPDQGYHTPGWMNLKDNLRRNKTILGASMGVKACTMSLKISVVDKYMHAYMCELYGFGPHVNKTGWKLYKEKFNTKARVIIGFAKDEEARLLKSNKSHIFLPKWKREHIQYVYPLIEEGWNRELAQKEIGKYRKDIPPPSNCMICFYQSDQELLWLWRNYPEEFYDWVELEKAKLEKHQDMGKKNYGVYGTITLTEKLDQAKKKYGHWSDEQLWDYKMSHGHCVKSSY